jgi:hypothetical protein
MEQAAKTYITRDALAASVRFMASKAFQHCTLRLAPTLSAGPQGGASRSWKSGKTSNITSPVTNWM